MEPIAGSSERTANLRIIQTDREKRENSKKHCEQLYANKLDNLHEMDNFQGDTNY